MIYKFAVCIQAMRGRLSDKLSQYNLSSIKKVRVGWSLQSRISERASLAGSSILGMTKDVHSDRSMSQ